MEPAALPDDLVDELARLLDEPEAEFWAAVDRLCEQRPELAVPIRAEAAAMHAAAASSPGSHTAAAVGRTRLPETAELRPGDRVGAFVVLETIGHGGMGSVFLAEQKQPVRRRVALKVIKPGMDSRAVLARFEAERQALALMDHPNIARVFEAGMTRLGRPYFAMEYVKGIPITRYCDKVKLSVDDRLRLFQQVCRGVQHAHTKGVIHRDLTPANILISLVDGKPAAKIIDFGLARATDHRLTERTLFTEHGAILGTPEYMSPEQAEVDALDIDMRSDVYTLGVLLYELLTGQLPFERSVLRQAGYDAMCRTIREAEPPRPSTKVTTRAAGTDAVARLRRTDAGSLLRRLRGDLDWIVLKCLEKDRTRRYETVSELAADVGRHLGHEPVTARAPSFAYRLAKLGRRYRGRLVAAGLVLAALLAGLAVSTRFWLVAAAGARAAEEARGREAARAAEALARKREFDLLAGVVLLDRARAAEQELYPPWPDRVAAMESWLAVDAGRLLAMRPELERTVSDLRDRTPPAAEAEAHRFLSDTLGQLAAEVATLADDLVPAVERRLRWARCVAELSAAHPGASVTWAQARAAIAAADGVVASEFYRGSGIELHDADVVGLVPIGMNPTTKLWEFYDLRSAWDGAADPAAIAIPVHDAAGAIDVDDATGIVFVLLPGGDFTMGSQSSDPDAPNFDPERDPQESLLAVRLEPFFLARHELTQGQWLRLTGEARGHYRAGTDPGGLGLITLAHPVEQVDWLESDRWLRRYGLLLPTEAQLEYGCRAGTTTPFWCPRAELGGCANIADASAKARTPWPCEAWSDGRVIHAPVGSYRANPFGLFDTHGNVWEWSRDGYHGLEARPRDGDGLRGDPAASASRVFRGGSHASGAKSARSAYRGWDPPTQRISVLGLRASRSLRR